MAGDGLMGGNCGVLLERRSICQWWVWVAEEKCLLGERLMAVKGDGDYLCFEVIISYNIKSTISTTSTNRTQERNNKNERTWKQERNPKVPNCREKWSDFYPKILYFRRDFGTLPLIPSPPKFPLSDFLLLFKPSGLKSLHSQD
ncbi:hypothetical protein CEXT_573511 [Caerostris extrusa]|uniref:Uncharacterized protein n=1 Tax=Caerostris extrusa TaxID=172846 RepID=A0AAV4S8Z1_CAEEX|nr:hypothetical protein CEXT_573511 [Caerostris extrusa]